MVQVRIQILVNRKTTKILGIIKELVIMESVVLETLSHSSCLAPLHPHHILSHLVQPLKTFEDDDMAPEEKPGSDRLPESDMHPLKFPSGVGRELWPGTMVGLDTCADCHLVLRPVVPVNTGHKNRADSQVVCVCMNLQFAGRQRLKRVGARRSVRHSYLRDLFLPSSCKDLF